MSLLSRNHGLPWPGARRWSCACLLALLAGGCAQKDEEVVVWEPRPLVDWALLATPDTPNFQPISDKAVLLVQQPTQGLFPAAIAVTRVALTPPWHEPDPQSESDRPLEAVLTADPRNEFLPWNAALDNQMAVSEVFPVMERDLGGGPADPPQVLAASRALGARLALMYAVNELAPDETEMMGVLYDARAGTTLAALHAQATSRPLPEDVDEEQVDIWEFDSRALVRARFEQQLHHCIRALILQDNPPAVRDPEGWTPVGPTFPVEWPPDYFRPRR